MAVQREMDAPDWQNVQVLSINREPAHASLLPCPDEECALSGERGASPWFRLLNGNWRFMLVPYPDATPEGFEAEEFDASEWDTIPVPATGRCTADRPHTNITTQSYDPPVPDETRWGSIAARSWSRKHGWAGASISPSRASTQPSISG